MGKRYTYFRMPNGKPYKGQDAKYAPAHILAEIGKTATANTDGQVSWSGSPFSAFLLALRSAFAVIDSDGFELNETDSWEIIWEAIVDLVKKAPGKRVDSMGLLKKADELAGAFLRTLPKNYVLVSSLSIEDLPAKRITVSGCTVSPLAERGKKFPLPDELSWQLRASA